MLTDKLADCLKEPQKPLLEFQAIAVCISVLLLINIALSPWILRFRIGAFETSGIHAPMTGGFLVGKNWFGAP